MNPDLTEARKLVPYRSSSSSLDDDESGKEDSVDSESDSEDSGDESSSDVSENSKSLCLDEVQSKIEELEINVPSEKCEVFGKVKSLIENQVIVEPEPDKAALDIGTVLFLDNGAKAMGRIDEAFGPIAEPLYIVLFASAEKIAAAGIVAGTVVYFAPTMEHTSYVFLPDLLKMKGSDASCENNKEMPPEMQEPSDTEDETTPSGDHRRQTHQRKRPAPNSRWKQSLSNQQQQSFSSERNMHHNYYYPPPLMPFFNSHVPPPQFSANTRFPPPLPPFFPMNAHTPMYSAGPAMHNMSYGPHPVLPPPPPPHPVNRDWQNQSPLKR